MNNNLEFENEDPNTDNIEDNHPRTNYGGGFDKTIKTSWNRDEVISLLHKFMQYQHPDWHHWSTVKWAEQNL